jgi:hypothetical protein
MQGHDGQLSEFLLDAGILSRSQLLLAAQRAQERNEALGDALVGSGVLTEEEVRRAAAHALCVPYIELASHEVDSRALALIPEPLCRAHGVVAFAASERGVEVALLNLEALPMLDFLRERMRVLPRLTSRESLRRALFTYQKMLKDRFDGSAASLVAHAMSQSAAAVHLDPTERGLRVLYRIDGRLHEAMLLSRERGERLLRELKESKEVKLSIAPVANGERAVVHLLGTQENRKGFTLESLGLHGEPAELLYSVLRRRSGLVKVAGPSGSGVTTTLYTLFDLFNRPDRNLVSVERHIEHRFAHAVQTEVNEAAGLLSAAAVRAALRQDPDVLLLSDIEDEAALRLAAPAAGRLVVLAGGPEEVLGAGETLVRVRLVRKLCMRCATPATFSRAELSALEEYADFGRVLAALKDESLLAPGAAWKDVPFLEPRGCEQCEGGYLGVVGVQEVRVGGSSSLSLVEDALFKAAAGRTNIGEVLAVAAGESK